jgi:hypothetical protein
MAQLAKWRNVIAMSGPKRARPTKNLPVEGSMELYFGG